MGMLLYKPRFPLSNFVDSIWYFDGPMQSHKKDRMLPDGSMDLVINLVDDEIRVYHKERHDECRSFRGPVVGGPYSEAFVIDTAEQAHCVGVQFKPGGAYPFLGLPSNELKDNQVPLDLLWGARAYELRNRVLEAEQPREKLLIVEQLLLEQATRDLIFDPAINFSLKQLTSAWAPRIGDLADQIGFSNRRLIQLFSDHVGLTPKVFGRLQRFQHAVRHAYASQVIDWADIAVTAGYYDQAHLVNEFRTISGLSPTEYARQRGDFLKHVPIPE
jgi:AraC-like DNA-binding protein